MTKTIWIDFDKEVVYQSENELEAEYEREVEPLNFSEWLHENFSACDVWEWTEDDRKEIEADFEEAKRYNFCDWVRSTFKVYEIRV